MISKFIKDELGLTPTASDPCLFWKRSKNDKLMLMFLFVDDFQISYHITDSNEWIQLKKKLIDTFRAKDMGASTWILGMRIKRDRTAHTITLDQELYITKLLEKFGLTECSVVDTPMVVRNGNTEDDGDGAGHPTGRQQYMEIVGSLLYAAISTRPDISYVVQYLTRFMILPLHRHRVIAERVLRYLAGTKDVGLLFGRRKLQHSKADIIELSGHCDADWAKDTDRKSITGWIVKVNGDPISWKCGKQGSVALSSCEAELYAEGEAIREVLFQSELLRELSLTLESVPIVHCDNKSTMEISKKSIKGEATKQWQLNGHLLLMN